MSSLSAALSKNSGKNDDARQCHRRYRSRNRVDHPRITNLGQVIDLCMFLNALAKMEAANMPPPVEGTGRSRIPLDSLLVALLIDNELSHLPRMR